MKISVKIAEQTFEVEVGDLSSRPILATVDGEIFEVWPEQNEGKAEEFIISSPTPSRIPTLPVTIVVNKSSTVAAPIPGVITAVKVKPGDPVTAGQELCTLEAMKMKNAIRANREGTIHAVLVEVGDHVRHAQPLMKYDD